MTAASVLFVTTDAEVIAMVRRHLSGDGGDLRVASSLEEAAKALARRSFDALLVQIDAPDGDVRRRLEQGFTFRRQPPVIALARNGAIEDAVNAVRAGACDFIPARPGEGRALRDALCRALSACRDGLHEGRTGASGGVPLAGFITADHRTLAVCETLARVADSTASIVIEGESGTGKSLLARLVHENSMRRLAPFVELNCGALSESLLASELFGHVRGAFTSAEQSRVGKFELADGGTLLLDEVANASRSLQAKLLRALESGEFERVGDTQTRRSHVRLMVATNSPLEQQIARGLFSEQLYHRLNAVKVEIPPLRERVVDIPLLAQHFLRRCAAQHGRTISGVSPEVLSALVRNRWPGNVRELRNAVEHGVILARETTIELDSLPRSIVQAWAAPRGLRRGLELLPLKEALREPERQYILQTLRAVRWNKQHAAKELRISRSTLYKKIKEYGLEPEPAVDGPVTSGAFGTLGRQGATSA